MAEQSNKQTIAKNTILLYVRMLLSILVSLYTSRVVLQTLGVVDYGIYGVVGGVVSMFSFLNASMTGATSRFLLYAIGKGDQEQLRATFSSAMNIHILIALVVFVISETFGLWFLCNKLVIPEERMVAAHLVFQFSVISMFFSVTQVPYDAVIVAHEKMDVYAYIELLNVFLKLGIVYLLLIGNFDKLILYAGLSLCVTIFIVLVYRFYCLRHYQESKYYFVWKKEILKPMLSFSGWDMYGNTSVVFFTQGIAMLLNMFFGPVLNTANSISTTVQGTIKGFAYNVIQAFRPQIIKQYAQGHIEAVNQYCVMATQYTLVLYSVIAIPFFFKAEYILHLWLGLVPDHSIFFLRTILLGTVLNLANNILNIPIHACGKMKLFSFATGSCFFLCIPLMYVLLKLGCSANSSYQIVIFSYMACFVVTLFILRRNVPNFDIKQLALQGYSKYVICVIPGIILSVFASYIIKNELISFLGVLFFNGISILVCTSMIIMSKQDRKKCLDFVKSKLKH